MSHNRPPFDDIEAGNSPGNNQERVHEMMQRVNRLSRELANYFGPVSASLQALQTAGKVSCSTVYQVVVMAIVTSLTSVLISLNLPPKYKSAAVVAMYVGVLFAFIGVMIALIATLPLLLMVASVVICLVGVVTLIIAYIS
ncbi:OLC1v1001869C1 [Oldenlandia corymbosa var. corymbosa]|uniref:OLC1v1001869C1 n=1 Tax=Oldenlandia corymbosa var. corymbosa TaxID=529605 RepID=A0AAV1D6I6_OLDCO|nr:OLC1v1001869C1 [Oldenlandia corymbosa var. corymbosa]